jgi:uncharacterized alkaline shock family protein YloU
MKMTLEILNDYGKIDISNEVIASVVGSKAVESVLIFQQYRLLLVV